MKQAIIGAYTLYDPTAERIDIDSAYPNPSFNWNLASDDQALIKLKQPSTKPTVTLNFDPSIPGQEGEAITVIGFGSTASGTLPNVLQQTTVNYIANNVCASLKSGPNSYQGKITSDMICVHGSNSGQCNGDSGGPYLLLGNSYATDVQVGIVSW